MRFTVDPKELAPILVSKQEFAFLQDFLGSDPADSQRRAVQQKWIKLDDSQGDDKRLFDHANDEGFGSFLEKMDPARCRVILKSLFVHLIREGYDAGVDRIFPYLEEYNICSKQKVSVQVDEATHPFSFFELAIACGRSRVVQCLINNGFFYYDCCDADHLVFTLACDIAIQRIATHQFYYTLDVLILARKILDLERIRRVAYYALNPENGAGPAKHINDSADQGKRAHDMSVVALGEAIRRNSVEHVKHHLNSDVLRWYLFSQEDYESFLGAFPEDIQLDIPKAFIAHAASNEGVRNHLICSLLWNWSIGNKQYALMKTIAQDFTLSCKEIMEYFQQALEPTINMELAKTIFECAPQEYKKNMLLWMIRWKDCELFNRFVGHAPDTRMLKLLTDIAISNSTRFTYVFSTLNCFQEKGSEGEDLLAIHILLDIYNIGKTAGPFGCDDDNARVPQSCVEEMLRKRVKSFRHYSSGCGLDGSEFKAYERSAPEHCKRVAELFEYAVSNHHKGFFDYLLQQKPELATHRDSDGRYILSGENLQSLQKAQGLKSARATIILDQINHLRLFSIFVSANYIIALLKQNDLIDSDSAQLTAQLTTQGHTHAAEKLSTADTTAFVKVDVNDISVLAMLWFCVRSIFCSVPVSATTPEKKAAPSLFSKNDTDGEADLVSESDTDEEADPDSDLSGTVVSRM